MSTESLDQPKPKFSSDRPESELIEHRYFARNFLWICPLLIILIGLVSLYLNGYFQLDLMKDPADASLTVVDYDSVVAEKIGVPVKRDDSIRVTGTFEMKNSKEYAKMDKFKVTGPKGEAVVYGTMVRSNNNQGWRLWRLAIDFADGETIFIPKDGPATNTVD